MKRIIPFLVALTMVVCLSACTSGGNGNSSGNGSGTDEVKNELLGDEYKLNYTSDKEFLIYPYGGVPGKLRVYDANGALIQDNIEISDDQMREYYRQLKETGMTMTSGGYYMTYQDYVRQLKFCEEFDIKMMVYDANLVALLKNTGIGNGEAVTTILENYHELFESPAFAGISVDDEPSPAELSGFKTALQRWRLIEEIEGRELIFYINLFPSIAFRTSSDGTFSDYIAKFVSEVDVDYVCYDHYVLFKGRDGNYLGKDFLYNLITARLNGGGRKMYTVLQSIKYGGLNRELECADDVTFQMYGAIACGYEGFGWFCFWPPVPNDGATNFGAAAYDRQTNQPTPTYYYLKEGINEVKKLQDVFFNFEWQGIRTVIGTDNNDGGENEDFIMSAAGEISTPGILGVKTQQDTVIGVFKDKEGQDGYMVVPFVEPSSGLKNKVSIQFAGCTKVAVWENGEQKVYTAPDGKFNFTQTSGDGYFIVPLA